MSRGAPERRPRRERGRASDHHNERKLDSEPHEQRMLVLQLDNGVGEAPADAHAHHPHAHRPPRRLSARPHQRGAAEQANGEERLCIRRRGRRACRRRSGRRNRPPEHRVLHHAGAVGQRMKVEDVDTQQVLPLAREHVDNDAVQKGRRGLDRVSVDQAGQRAGEQAGEHR
eukprot:1482465-Pleurochrysis_carterae.AAC.5